MYHFIFVSSKNGERNQYIGNVLYKKEKFSNIFSPKQTEPIHSNFNIAKRKSGCALYLPPMVTWAAVGKENNSSSLVDIHSIGEPKRSTLGLWCQPCSYPTVRAHNEEPMVCISNVQITTHFIEMQTQWSATNMLPQLVIERPFTSISVSNRHSSSAKTFKLV